MLSYFLLIYNPFSFIFPLFWFVPQKRASWVSAEDGADPFAAYKSLAKKDWHDYAAMENDKRRVGPGEGGKPVAIPTDPEIKKKQVSRVDLTILVFTSFLFRSEAKSITQSEGEKLSVSSKWRKIFCIHF